jgi:predicted metalloprotease
VKNAIADISAYWKDEFPQVYGTAYTPVGRVVAAGPGTRIPECQSQPVSYKKLVKGNAFYCFGTNYVAYDAQDLFPKMVRNFGNFAPALVLAHEWGHAIQDRANINWTNEPTILVELQADCFAGSWVRRVANGDSPKVKFAPGDLDRALAAYLTLRDPVGSSANDRQAHGDAFDRVNAFQTGFNDGAPACKRFFDAPPQITEQQFSSQQEAETGGNLTAAQVLPVTMDLLTSYYGQTEPGIAPLTIKRVASYSSAGPKRQLPKCGGAAIAKRQYTNRVFYCLDDNYIGFDEPLLDHIYTTIGDFGVGTLVASTYATYIQFQQSFPGVKVNAVNAVLGADCYTGSWAAAVKNGLPSATLDSTVSLSPGDLDKAIQAFIAYDAARGVSSKINFVFLRLEAFRTGYFDGYASCAPAFANQ